MKDGACTKKFPKDLLQETQSGDDGYPLYRRRKPDAGGFTAKMKIRGGDEIEIDNRWIVPYSPLFCKTFQAHINVEYCNSVKAIKYICKYVNKGSDQAAFGLVKDGNAVDEVDRFQTGRYISSGEAAWRILDFPIHERHPTVVHLSVHLKDGQRVCFTENNAAQQVENPKHTTLQAFFKLCEEDDFAKTLLYCQVPKYYTWNVTNRVWKRRSQGTRVVGHEGIRASDALGRVYTVHPNNFECFCLRLLLHEVRGPTSFEALKTVDARVCATYREACQERGLLESDAHWDETLTEAAVSQSPARLRDLFAILLTTCGVSNPRQLWEDHKGDLTEDILYRVR
jgi:hypothetical protein